MASFEIDAKRSRIALEFVVWPAIKHVLDGATLRITEGSRDGTDVDLDMGGGVDAWMTTRRGSKHGIANRVQFGQPFWTTTIRYHRRSGARTEWLKRQIAVEEGGNMPTLRWHSYVTLDGSRLLVAGIVGEVELAKHQLACVGAGRGNHGCFMRETDNASFIASDWRHLMGQGIPVTLVAPGQPCMYPVPSDKGDGLTWGCRTETLDLGRVVNSLVKCSACGNWSTAPVAAGVLLGTGT
ncbi:MAG: hypothetical protein WCK73_14520 [Deltaproteobacteria bacterium]